MKKAMGLAAAVSVLLLGAASAFATPITVVRWDGTDNPVSANQSLTAGNNSTSVSSSYANPTQGSNYYPNYLTQNATPFFYAAGYRIYQGEQRALNTYRITNSGSDDYLDFRASEAGAGSAYAHGIVLWRQSDFLGSTAAGLHGMTMETGSNSAYDRGRFVVQLANDNYYVSEQVGQNNRAPNSFTDPTTISWFNYDPMTDFSAIGSAATLSASDFQGFKAAGVYFYTTRSGLDTNAYAQLYNFSVTAIPEPGTVGLALGGLALIAIRRRIRG